jgi:hypothetical protein
MKSRGNVIANYRKIYREGYNHNIRLLEGILQFGKTRLQACDGKPF